jgi:hypothetical protein
MGYCRIISFVVFLFTILQFSYFTDVQGGECKLLTSHIQGIFVNHVFNSGGTPNNCEAVRGYQYLRVCESTWNAFQITFGHMHVPHFSFLRLFWNVVLFCALLVECFTSKSSYYPVNYWDFGLLEHNALQSVEIKMTLRKIISYPFSSLNKSNRKPAWSS